MPEAPAPPPIIIRRIPEDPAVQEKRLELLAAIDISSRELLREKGTPYAERGHADPKWTDDQLLDLMLEHAILTNRAIVVAPLGTKLCRPSKAVLDILPNPGIGPFT